MQHFAFASDEGYFPGLLTAATSLALACDITTPTTIHVLDGGISAESWRVLETQVRRCLPSARVTRLGVAGSEIFGIQDNRGKGPMAYARLMLPRLVAAERIVYIDSDCLILHDPAALARVDLGGRTCGAIQDPITRHLGDDYPWPRRPEFQAQKPYLNSGVLVIDCAAWKAAQISERTLALLEREGQSCRYWDQTALNFTLEDQWCPLPSRWNFPSGRYECDRDDPAIIHYLCLEKPWQGDPGGDAHALWRVAASEMAGLPARRLRRIALRDQIARRAFDFLSPGLALWYSTQRVLHARSEAKRHAAIWARDYWLLRHASQSRRESHRTILAQSLAARQAGWRLELARRKPGASANSP